MPRPNPQPSNFRLQVLALLLLATFPLTVKAQCSGLFGNTFSNIYVNESGQFRTDQWMAQKTTLNKDESGWSSISVQESNMKPFFEVTETGTDFVLKVGLRSSHCKWILFSGFQFKWLV